MSNLKKCLLLGLSLCFCLALWSRPAYAFIKLNEQFLAGEACVALQSIRKGTNPGNIQITPQQIYQVLGKNRADESHYLLKIEEAQPSRRWVSVECGQLLGTFSELPADEDLVAPAPPTNEDLVVPAPPANEDYLLALSWQPSFCETKPSKPECQSQTAQRFDATNLVLHGLWPQPRGNDYCNLSQDIIDLDKNGPWSELPPINLSEETRQELAIKMPGMTSDLHLHEWYKHGTCYSDSPEEYYQESLALLDQVNNSVVGDLLENNIGKFLSSDTIRNQFDQAFSDGAGSKVQVRCKEDIDEDQNDMVVELFINLKGNIELDTPIEILLEKGKTVSAGCSLGEIDPAGFN
ncbi:MAG: ribonuclease T [Symploca sp. SIO2E6]|nr:ribonuclease T [Symploca sp. SIO2E6]